MTVGFIAKLLNGSVVSYLKSALLISNISFLLGLGGLVKLISLDYSQRVMKTTILLLLLFPTSFYFGSVYTESLFLALAVWALYFARKGKWLSSGLSIALASATRLVGVALIPTLLLELWITKKWKTVRGIISILLSSTGILGYMYYLKMATGDPLEFLHSISIFGAQRSSTFIMLPQVFYRYVFKILPNINYNYFPVVFTTWLEFLTAVLFFIVCTLAFLASLRKLGSIKMPWSYTTFLILGYVIPTLSGSFSSLPRYVLVLFPGYILIAALINKTGKYIRYAVYFVSFVLLFISCALFVRGYWVS
jgi:Gpi18-like mannosyltransferase